MLPGDYGPIFHAIAEFLDGQATEPIECSKCKQAEALLKRVRQYVVCQQTKYGYLPQEYGPIFDAIAAFLDGQATEAECAQCAETARALTRLGAHAKAKDEPLPSRIRRFAKRLDAKHAKALRLQERFEKARQVADAGVALADACKGSIKWLQQLATVYDCTDGVGSGPRADAAAIESAIKAVRDAQATREYES
jgi:hypothetical protein